MTNYARTPWLCVPASRPRASLRLVLLPHAGAGAARYVPWAECLPEWIELLIVRLPGRETRLSEPAIDQRAALVSALAQGLRGHVLPPFALFGHSMGGLLAFELSAAWRDAASAQPIMLGVSGCGPPHLPKERTLHLLSDEELCEELTRMGGLAREVLDHAEIRQLAFPLLRADLRVCDTSGYAVRAPLKVPLRAYCGREDVAVSIQNALRWAELVDDSFELKDFPGGHFFLHENRDLVLAALVNDLRAALRASSASGRCLPGSERETHGLLTGPTRPARLADSWSAPGASPRRSSF